MPFVLRGKQWSNRLPAVKKQFVIFSWWKTQCKTVTVKQREASLLWTTQNIRNKSYQLTNILPRNRHSISSCCRTWSICVRQSAANIGQKCGGLCAPPPGPCTCPHCKISTTTLHRCPELICLLLSALQNDKCCIFKHRAFIACQYKDVFLRWNR